MIKASKTGLVVVAAAASMILAGCAQLGFGDDSQATMVKSASSKSHACKGVNSCKGKNSCKSANSCSGKNSCSS